MILKEPGAKETPILFGGSAFLVPDEVCTTEPEHTGNSWSHQRKQAGSWAWSRDLLSEVRIEEVRPIDRLKRPGKRTQV